VLLAGPASAAPRAPTAPTAPTAPVAPGAGNIGISVGNGSPSSSITLILAITVLSIAPSVLLLCTSFTKIIIVLGLTRNALGLPTSPPNQVLTGIALFLTLFVMGPVLSKVNHQAIQPALSGKIGWAEAAKKGYAPLQVYMERQVKIEDVALFTNVSGAPRPKAVTDVPPRVLIPAFVLSELRRAFLIGFIVYVPFLVVDLVVSSGLMSLGMVMLPPVVISLPLKLLLFVLVDGWGLLVRSLLTGAKGG
jgi:flagellar biosynthetic protein FliP